MKSDMLLKDLAEVSDRGFIVLENDTRLRTREDSGADVLVDQRILLQGFPDQTLEILLLLVPHSPTCGIPFWVDLIP